MFQGLNRRLRAPDAPAEAIAIPEAVVEIPVPQVSPPSGPRIGIALGGGAARGFAHIGVMRVLEKHGIRPHVVAGTSIGAVVGGLWAAGKIDALESWARSLKKRDVLGMLDFTFGGAGIIGGRRLVDLMRRQMDPVLIEEMSPTFAAIATELGSGHEIWLTRGDLVEAIHASFSLPGIFTPVKVGGRWLMDGALVNPIPVSAARAMGARIVIAVNLNSDVFGKGTVIHDHGSMLETAEAAIVERKARFGAILRPDRLLRRQFFSGPPDGPRGISSVMIDAFNITQDRIARSRLAGDPPDVSISPKLGKIGLFEFQRADEAIAAGAEAAEKMIDDLKAAMVALA
ncbi:phospholipase [Azorhizobium oxalatiphilum]|uniref:Phospholipase n=1 Tax=Azorhizobium oxalatiphilum TaxID=980631 RepID=A0A917FJT9_9HYPH|nr:patatin-like phospholipase family protein [Azorhizobium oxalatiphilum]GGF85126.1 phospholipase [Azorhizobium oxalatiphilum]